MIKESSVRVQGHQMHYRHVGDGEPVVMLHGWPTSSYLWRKIIPIIGSEYHAIAPDLIGFGKSDKPTDVAYTLDFMSACLDEFMDGLGIESVHLMVHDLGGPVGLYWASQQQDRIRTLTLLNTLVYSDFSPTVKAFLKASKLPGARWMMTRPTSLKMGIKLGVADSSVLADEVYDAVQAPFKTKDARTALYKSVADFDPERFKRIEKTLPQYTCPVRIIYGVKDRALPDVAQTMARVKADLPQAKVTALPKCGHFIQEEKPEHIGTLLLTFLQRHPTSTPETP